MKKPDHDKTVSVALCTCNGEKYLRQQLDSLTQQSYLPAEVVICDDHSEDNTLLILKQFIEEAPFPTALRINKKRIGIVENFSQAISLCKGEYVAICDQDDLWIPERIKLGLAAMAEAEKMYGTNIPFLIHSDLKVIDNDGKLLAPSYMKMRRIRHYDQEALRKLMLQNFVTGCTVLLNRPLVELALPIPGEAYMHDWWLALVAAAAGKIIYLEQPTVFYRQHSSNVIGVNRFFSSVNVKLVLDINRMEENLAKIIRQVDAAFGHLVSSPGSFELSLFQAYFDSLSRGGLRSVYLSCKNNFKMQGLIRNLYYYNLLLKGGYRKYL